MELSDTPFLGLVFRDRQTWSVNPKMYASVVAIASLTITPGEVSGIAAPTVPIPSQSS